MIAVLLAAATLSAADPSCAAGDAGAACRAVAASAAGRFADAAPEFETAAKKATGAERDRALAAAGNMWLAAGQPARAAVALDSALSGGGLTGVQRGEALLDRARVAFEQKNLAVARARLSEAQGSVGDDPFYWYFSAAVAIEENKLDLARSANGRALALVPNDPASLVQAGDLALLGGDQALARTRYRAAVAAAGASDAFGREARDKLARLDQPAAPTTARPAPAQPRTAQPRS